jgi:hypothetical protein
MLGIALVLVFVALIGPLSIFYGADSRVLDVRDRRRWWPAARD